VLCCQAYMYNDDDFNWNHGLSLASTGNYKAAEVNAHGCVSRRASAYLYIAASVRSAAQASFQDVTHEMVGRGQCLLGLALCVAITVLR
jgi:hypothetical protein